MGEKGEEKRTWGGRKAKRSEVGDEKEELYIRNVSRNESMIRGKEKLSAFSLSQWVSLKVVRVGYLDTAIKWTKKEGKQGMVEWSKEVGKRSGER